MMYIYLNGSFVPAAQALISVADRGFRLGDGVFETIPVYHGSPYQWPFHRDRLTAGLAALRIPVETATLEVSLRELITRNEQVEGSVRLTISRGVGSAGYLPVNCTPTIVMESMPPRAVPQEAIALWKSSSEKPSPRSLPTHCKTAQGLNSTLARMEAAESGCFDALMLAEGGILAETSSANLFWLQGGTLHTPALSTGALPGSARHAVMRLSPWPVKEVAAPLSALQSAEAVMITSSSIRVLPVASLHPEGWQWKSEAAAAELLALLQADITQACAGH